MKRSSPTALVTLEPTPRERLVRSPAIAASRRRVRRRTSRSPRSCAGSKATGSTHPRSRRLEDKETGRTLRRPAFDRLQEAVFTGAPEHSRSRFDQNGPSCEEHTMSKLTGKPPVAGVATTPYRRTNSRGAGGESRPNQKTFISQAIGAQANPWVLGPVTGTSTPPRAYQLFPRWQRKPGVREK